MMVREAAYRFPGSAGKTGFALCEDVDHVVMWVCVSARR